MLESDNNITLERAGGVWYDSRKTNGLRATVSACEQRESLAFW